MRRRHPRPRVMLAWLAALAVPLVLCLGLAYVLSLLHYRAETQQAAETNARRIAGILQRGDEILEFLANSTGGECGAFAETEMARAVFQSVYFREAGIERDQRLLCTSLGPVAQPMVIDNASRSPVGRFGKIEILAPKQTLQGGHSIILNRPLDGERRHFINLLLNPQVLVEMLDFHPDLQAVTLLEFADGGRVLALDSAPSAEATQLRPPLRTGVQWVKGGLAAVARTGELPIYTVVTVGDAEIAQHWRQRMQPAVIAGFAMMGLAMLLMRRYLPQRDLVEDLRQGIEAEEISLLYQPIVDARDGSVVGVEALARWQHPQRGLVMPDEFIPLAEETGLVLPLTELVLRLVKADLGLLPAGVRVHINLARPHLADDSLLTAVDRVFGADGDLGRLGFEVTERELLANVAEQARAVVKELARRGAEVALDDFGTGYSGLSHLRHLPLHHIKIDRSFVWALDTEAVTASLVQSIVLLAHSLGLGLVAEGVETAAQRDRLLALGVPLHQGWLYAKAMAPAELRDFAQRPRSPAVPATEAAAAP